MKDSEQQAEKLFQDWLNQAMDNPGLSRAPWVQRAEDVGAVVDLDSKFAEFDLLCSRFLNPSELIRPGRRLGEGWAISAWCGI